MEITLDIFETNEFYSCFRDVNTEIRIKLPAPKNRKANPYDKLREKGLLDRNTFAEEYFRCAAKKSDLPAAERRWILLIGDIALKSTINILQKETHHGKKQTDNVGRAV
jgi:hypothetical protein